ncbi:hypothetical protein AJ79_04206 [Helicocarpus griseus UAMH5409]|uniref:L-ornithine N(5)-oxygenase n=1 Tax=Helicocarpus griseus UAMH5409 TaxID=1447875 RepID=A0A2B7XUG7_9EURO|nr:hypothetical protein AJ79_04206 [Helicocarpus griseus UAMH5409]
MSTIKPDNGDAPSYTQVACIGTGVSAVALGATLKNWYNFDDIRFFDRNPASGGTWWANRYPGCACDIWSALYSFSFHLNPGWTTMLPSANEIKAYNDNVIEKYNLQDKMTFSTEVVRCEWDGEASRWTMYLHDLKTGEKHIHTCQILFSAVGQLVVPRECDIPGKEKFKGHIFHSAQWDSSVSLKDKNVVVIGNGCTGSQIVPAILYEVKHLTQIVRSKHWIVKGLNAPYPAFLKWIFQHIPLAMRLHRLHIYLITESSFPLFQMTKKGAKLREKKRREIEGYMRKTSPAKYHDLLIPDFEIGCKRRIFDSAGYLTSLNAANITLTNEKPLEILHNGIKSDKGFIEADVIVLATGFQTNEFLHKTEIVGRDGLSIKDYWARYPGPVAYNSSAVSGFPNFFMLLGPNSATGHTSVLIAAENSVNYALRVLKSVFKGETKSVEIKQGAEESYAHAVQDALNKSVFNAGGCRSWYINANNWNAFMYPWSQAYFWYRSLFPIWSDWKIEVRLAPSDNICAQWALGMEIAAQYTDWLGNYW